MKLIADEDYYSNNSNSNKYKNISLSTLKEDFSGFAILSDWNDNPLDGYRLEKGKVVASTRNDSSGSPNAKAASCQPICQNVCVGMSMPCCVTSSDPGSYCCTNTYMSCYPQCYYLCVPDPPIVEPNLPAPNALSIASSSFVDLSQCVDMAGYDWTDLDGDPCIYRYGGEGDLTRSELFMEILKDKTMSQLGITDAVAALSVLSGANIISTRQKFGLTTNGTSVASKYLSNLLPYQSPMRLPTLTGFPFVGQGVRLAMTQNVGRFIGRTIPLLGWGIAAYDLYRILEETTKEYNNVITAQKCV